MEKILELKNLSVARGGRKVFSGLSLDVPVGCNTAILGPNGAGKSTFLKLLTRELYPMVEPGAEIRIFGEKLWNVRELRSRLGIVSNDLQRNFPEETLGRDVVYSGYFGGYGLWRDQHLSSARRRTAREIMGMLEIEHLAGREFGTLSTGEQRRFLLARALVNKPQALVLDEPTGGLDLKSCFLYLQKMSELMQAGTTVVLVTHNLSEITPEFSRVVLLKKGEVFAEGSRESVITSENLSGLFDFPLAVNCHQGFFSVAPKRDF